MIKHDRLNLRPLRKEDSELLYKWITDRELCILNAPYKPVSEMEHEGWMESMVLERSDLEIFVIEDMASSLAIGTCQLKKIDWRNRNAELQIRIGDESFRGKGFGAKCIKMLVEFGFQDLNLHRISLEVYATNQRAITTYLKCGFIQEGIQREAAFVDGTWVDVITMGLLSAENG